MTEAAISKKDKPTVGEELFLVHLKRCREEELEQQQRDCGIIPPARKRSNSTVGEELWEIHLRRSQGLNEEDDRDVEEHASSTESMEKKASASIKNEAKACARYNLRSKDAPRKKA
ncbi:MAG: hypothetical protein SGILL_005061 [Bacillariaceae sp.]